MPLLLRRPATYERWVLERERVGYRRLVLQEWHRPAILPERMPEDWERLSWGWKVRRMPCGLRSSLPVPPRARSDRDIRDGSSDFDF
jgi:hypothetical protein